MNVAKVKYNSIGNAVGISTSLYVSGCEHRCNGCFQPETWNCKYGEPYTQELESKILYSLSPNHISNLVLLGGEPMMEYNIPTLINLCRNVKKLHPNKKIWIFSGWLYEDIVYNTLKFELLKLCDVLIDGKYIQELYSPKLQFRGSSNQRIIDVQESLRQNKAILYME